MMKVHFNGLSIETGPGNDVPPWSGADWVHDSADGEGTIISELIQQNLG